MKRNNNGQIMIYKVIQLYLHIYYKFGMLFDALLNYFPINYSFPSLQPGVSRLPLLHTDEGTQSWLGNKEVGHRCWKGLKRKIFLEGELPSKNL